MATENKEKEEVKEEKDFLTAIVDFFEKLAEKYEFDEEEQEGDTCLIYDELMLDFYFNEGELIDVVWGVLVDSEGNII